MGLPPAPRVGNPRVGGAPLALGGKYPPWPSPPPIQMGSWPTPPLQMDLGQRPPSQGAYIKGGGRAATLQPWAPPSSPATPLPLAEARRSPAEIPLHPPPRRRAAGSPSTSPSPLLDQEGGERRCSVRVLNAEVPSVRHSVIGDLDHGEYDSVIHVH